MKLVRDNIPDIINSDGKDCKYHYAGEEEFKTYLFEKLREELVEFIEKPNNIGIICKIPPDTPMIVLILLISLLIILFSIRYRNEPRKDKQLIPPPDKKSVSIFIIIF